LAVAGIIDAQELFYDVNGILHYQDSTISGEQYVLESILPACVHGDRPIVYDVGANVGDFSADVLTKFPRATVFAFEPHPIAFQKLVNRFSHLQSQVHCGNFGLGISNSELELYDYAEKYGSAHASHYREVLTGIHRAEKTAIHRARIRTLDDICKENGFHVIDLLKIDTEGHEMQVLRGAAGILAHKRVRLIQFEFNEMNVVSRTFLRDIYAILNDFEFYRLSKDRLIALGDYDTRHEIFKYHNILAISKHIRSSLPV
jgi:FkbM family methyltransferase